MSTPPCWAASILTCRAICEPNIRICTHHFLIGVGPMSAPNGGYFAQVREDSVALRDGLPVRPRAQLAGFAGCREIRLITRSGRYRVTWPSAIDPSAAEQRDSGIRPSVPRILS